MIKFFWTSNLSFIFISYFFVSFLVLLLFHSLKDIKTKFNSIKKSFIEYNFDFIDLWVFYFFLSFLIPIILLLILENFFKNNIFLEIFIPFLFLPLFMFFLYFFFNYLVYLKKLKKSEFPINNEFTYIKLLTFYKFKKISILDQIYIFLSYIIPSINIKYIEFLKNYKQEWDLSEYLINNFYTELLFKNYEDRLKEIINIFPEIKLDFKKLYIEINSKNLSKYHEYTLDREKFFYSIWINKKYDLNNISYILRLSKK